MKMRVSLALLAMASCCMGSVGQLDINNKKNVYEFLVRYSVEASNVHPGDDVQIGRGGKQMKIMVLLANLREGFFKEYGTEAGSKRELMVETGKRLYHDKDGKFVPTKEYVNMTQEEARARGVKLTAQVNKKSYQVVAKDALERILSDLYNNLQQRGILAQPKNVYVERWFKEELFKVVDEYMKTVPVSEDFEGHLHSYKDSLQKDFLTQYEVQKTFSVEMWQAILVTNISSSSRSGSQSSQHMLGTKSSTYSPYPVQQDDDSDQSQHMLGTKSSTYSPYPVQQIDDQLDAQDDDMYNYTDDDDSATETDASNIT